MKCPKCKATMKWQEGLLDDGTRDMTIGKHYCPACNIVGKTTESRAIKKGKRLAKGLIGVHCMDKKITRHSSTIQIGILRAMQHCATCGLPNYPQTEDNSCACVGCDCPYCESRSDND